MAALEAVFPCAEMELLWPEAGPVHKVHAVYVSSTVAPNTWIDVTKTIDAKIAALAAHRSQLGDRDVAPMILEWAADAARHAPARKADGGRGARRPKHAETFPSCGCCARSRSSGLLRGGRARKRYIAGELLRDAVLEVPPDVPDDPRDQDRADHQVEPVEIFPQGRRFFSKHHPEIRQPEAPRERSGEGVGRNRFMSILATPAGNAMKVRITGSRRAKTQSLPRDR